MENQRNINKINKELVEVQIEWYLKVARAWMNGNSKIDDAKKWLENRAEKDKIKDDSFENMTFCEPFFTSVPDYRNNKPLLMIVGQETNWFGNINSFDEDLDANVEIIKDNIKKSAEYVRESTLCSIVSIKYESNKVDRFGKKYVSLDKTTFWQMINKLADDYNICWNNLDKIHYRTENTGCIKLYATDEKELHSQFVFGAEKANQSLILHEIDIIKPDYVLFLTGPGYYKSMSYAFGCKKQAEMSGKRPTEENCLSEISCIKEKPCKCIWTYHPNYLKRKKLNDSVVNKMKEIMLK